MNPTHFPDRFHDEYSMTLRCVAPLILLTLAALGSGCSNTELQGSWMTPKFNGQKFTSFVVMGVSRETTLRRTAEDAFANQLASRGIRAVPSYNIFPSDPERLTREEVEQGVRRQAVQGAIVARVSKVEKQSSYSGGMASYGSPVGFGGAYQQNWGGSSIGGGSGYEYEVVTVDVQLYDVKSGDLVWSGVTQTFDTSNLESSTGYWAKVVIGELAKRGLL